MGLVMKTHKSSIKSPTMKHPSASMKAPKSPRMGKVTRHGGPKISGRK